MCAAAFDGFPYLCTSVYRALRHIILLPGELPEADLFDIARRQYQANRLDLCLVLRRTDGIWISGDGEEERNCLIPTGGIIVFDLLQPCRAFAASAEYMERRARLQKFSQGTRTAGYLVGTIADTLRPASLEDKARLGGAQPGAVPTGLSRCAVCGDWRGECLYPDGFGDRVAPVHCRCQNHNRCARCGGPLAEHRLNSNYYDEGLRRVMNVAGYCGLNHKC